MTEVQIASVKLFSSARRTGKSFDYLCIPNSIIERGTLVSVPFGKSNRKVYGIVEKVYTGVPEIELKSISEVYPEETKLSDGMLSLCDYMCKTLFCNFGDAARCMLPSFVYKGKDKTVKYYSISGGVDPLKCLSDFKGKLKPEYEKLLEYIRLSETASIETISELFPNAAKNLRFLEKKGFIKSENLSVIREPYKIGETQKYGRLPLTDEQNEAFSKLLDLYNNSRPLCALLHGVTGSGKTRVVLKLCDEVIESGKTVIFLVPEIALTSQTADMLYSYYKDKVAILHSSLSEGEKHDAVMSIRSGEKRIVIGTRSAVFAPVSNLGLIVMDEEQDQSYKSDTGVKYHARDIARFRCAKSDAMLLIMSATPDIDSYHKAKTGVYSLVTMKKRYKGNLLPEVEIADVRSDFRNDPSRLIGKRLDEEIKKNLSDKKQTILLMNRRGYKRFVSCTGCGEVIKCPNCSVSLTMHTGKENKLSCHYCGYIIPFPKECPTCHENHLMTHGAGIQQLEEELKKYYPTARVLRMDSDSTTGKLSHDKITNSFREGNADILIGTQMVAKGHNFPLVTLVGIVMADSSLYLSDYRAYEHTFSLLTQVIGRAGRADFPGRAVIQTLNPRHNVFSLASCQDYEKFYEEEISLRKSFTFPPFCDIAVFGLFDSNEERLNKSVEKFSNCLEKFLKGKYSDTKLIVYGPFDAVIYKIKNVYRRRFIIKYKNNSRSRELFDSLISFCDDNLESGTNITVDINPNMI